MKYCIWPDDTCCEEGELSEYLTFKSDDFIRLDFDGDIEDVPPYDLIVDARRKHREFEASR